MARILIYESTFGLELTERHDGLKDWEIHLLGNHISKDVEFDGNVFEWMTSRMEIYDSDEDNIGKCANCKVWTAYFDKPDPVMGVSIGAKVEGVLLCDLCLPKDHPRAF